MRRRAEHVLPNWAVGLIAAAVTAIALLLAFAGQLPWSGGYQLKAVFGEVQGLTVDSPVRIAGVEVGKITQVEHLSGAAADDTTASADPDSGATAESANGAVLVTMEISDEARPIRTDATMRLRPRLFLEGNYFIDLRPGTPSAPEADHGFVVPITNTSAPVQLDEVLTTLQSDVREDLRTLLDQLGNSLVRHGGARGLRELFRSSGGAYKSTSIVNQALLGTEPHDLSDLIGNLQTVVAALDRNEVALQGLVTNLNAVSGALAAEGEALEQTVAELPGTIDAARPALAALNSSFPAARAFAREALPGVRAATPAVEAATPLLRQVRGLVSRPELRGVARDLRPTIPKLAELARGTIPFLSEARALSSCFNEVVIPWANMTVPDPETPATGTVFEETSYGLVGISGESRSFDGNGPYARVLGGTGQNFVVFPPLAGTTDRVLGIPPLPILGARPALDSAVKPPFRRDVRCETNDPPNLDSGDPAPPPKQRPLAAPAGAIEPSDELRTELSSAAEQLEEAEDLAASEEEKDLRRARALTDEALEELNSALAEALGWEALLEETVP